MIMDQKEMLGKKVELSQIVIMVFNDDEEKFVKMCKRVEALCFISLILLKTFNIYILCFLI